MPEIRLSPDGDLAQRWDPDMVWQLVGGTHDGEVIPEEHMTGWVLLVPAELERFRLPLAEDPMSELDRRVLEAWRDAEALEVELGDRHDERVVRARMYAMGQSVAAATVGRPVEVWASPERRPLVEAWAKDHATLRDRLEVLAKRMDLDAETGEYRGGTYATEVLKDAARRVRRELEGRL